jgi:TRAP-type uncharacterized transport system fused permease subunit
VALGAAAGSTIAGASMVSTAFNAMRMGFVLYIVPFAFVYTPSLILHGSLFDAVSHIVTFLVGIAFVVGMTEGYMLGLGLLGKIYSPKRMLALISGLLLIFPNVFTEIGGAILGCVLYLPKVIARFTKKEV